MNNDRNKRIAKLKNKIFGNNKDEMNEIQKMENDENYIVISDDNPEQIDLMLTTLKLNDEEYKKRVLELHKKALREEI